MANRDVVHLREIIEERFNSNDKVIKIKSEHDQSLAKILSEVIDSLQLNDQEEGSIKGMVFVSQYIVKIT